MLSALRSVSPLVVAAAVLVAGTSFVSSVAAAVRDDAFLILSRSVETSNILENHNMTLLYSVFNVGGGYACSQFLLRGRRCPPWEYSMTRSIAPRPGGQAAVDSGILSHDRLRAILTRALFSLCPGLHSGCCVSAGRQRTWSWWTSPFRPSALPSWKALSPRRGHRLRLAHLSQRRWLSMRAGRAPFTPTRLRSRTSPSVAWRRYVHGFVSWACSSGTPVRIEVLLQGGHMRERWGLRVVV